MPDGKNWMAENLNYKPSTGNSWCYDNDSANCDRYGRLYDWPAAMGISAYYVNGEWNGYDDNHRGICPSGWHLPAKSEWDGILDADHSFYEYGFSVRFGGRLRYGEGGTWSDLPDSVFSDAYGRNYWWTATEHNAGSAKDMGIFSGYYGALSDNFNKRSGFSVRCVMDGKEPGREPVKTADIFHDMRDGKKYRTVTLGGQTWMARNLDYHTSSGSKCYDNENSNCAKYGRLYDWGTAMTACPPGWHLPASSEWDELVGWIEFTGGGNAGDKLKAVSDWRSSWGGYYNATDDYGFSALPGGASNADDDQSFNIGYHGYWWTATLSAYGTARFRTIESDGNFGNRVDGGEWRKRAKLSVRCVMDENISAACTLKLLAGPGGTVAHYPAKASYGAGKRVTLVATPRGGYTFGNWTGGRTANDTSAATPVTVDSNMVITANFRKIDYGEPATPAVYTLTLNAGPGGTASRNPGKASYNAGERVTITAYPDSGHAFACWTGGLIANATSATAVVSVNSSMVITANFREGAAPVDSASRFDKDGDTKRAAAAIFKKIAAFLNAIAAAFKKIAMPPIAYGKLIDARDSAEYKTVKIGKQVWMAENLKYRADNSWCGNNTWSREENTYNCEKYGRLYDWGAAKTACPAGWHLPAVREWNELMRAVGGKRQYYKDEYIEVYYWDGAGKKLKATSGWNYYRGKSGWSHWRNRDSWEDNDKRSGNGTDAYGFSALPEDNSGELGSWWTATIDEEIDDSHRALYVRIEKYHDMGYGVNDTEDGHQVRCVMGEALPDTFRLTLIAKIGGTVSTAPNKNPYTAGETVTISAVPDSGYEFDRWTGGRVANADSAVTAVIMNSKVAVTAGFRRVTPPVVYGTLNDIRDGNLYRTVKIGGLTWMAQNLNYKTAGSRCYDNVLSRCKQYGMLYDWNTANAICPAGWHLPTVIEWQDLFERAGGTDIAGKKLKAKSGWGGSDGGGNGNGTDAYGFSAMPGGRYSGGNFHYAGSFGGWWTDAERDSGSAWRRGIQYDYDIVDMRNGGKGDGLSVRCVADGGSAGVETGVKTGSAGADFKDAETGLEMVFVKGGTFIMGCTEEQDKCEDDEMPARAVSVSDFYIGRFAVTQGLWKAVTGGLPDGVSHGHGKGNNYPVYNVSWDDAQKFILALNSKSGKVYRLPTAAEWEYAARGGANSRGYTYSGSNNIGDVAWYNGNSRKKKHPVGVKAPNELGLYDMSGNVAEWMNDWHESYYRGDVHINPQGPASGYCRALRGGCYDCCAADCRVSDKGCWKPDESGDFIGFRLALPAAQKISESEFASSGRVSGNDGAFWMTLRAKTGGTVSAKPAKTFFNAGETVKIKASPQKGFAFDRWTGAGGQVANDTSATASVTVNSNMAITANFRVIHGSLSDTRNGKIYKTVKIGRKRWMAENLNYQPPSLNSWCYENSADSCEKYGRLYDWQSAMIACPPGWHLPGVKEWSSLIDAVGGKSVAGRMLKATSGWGTEYDGSGTDEYGFSALPGGFRSYNIDRFGFAGHSGIWWTATAETGSSTAENADMSIMGSLASVNSNYKSHGYSVRCVGNR
jgi:uncharacterized protein (TIGR02145 family)